MKALGLISIGVGSGRVDGYGPGNNFTLSIEANINDIDIRLGCINVYFIGGVRANRDSVSETLNLTQAG